MIRIILKVFKFLYAPLIITGMFFLPPVPIVGLSGLIIYIAYLFYFRRAAFYAFRANKNYNEGNIEKSFRIFDKAMKLPNCRMKTRLLYSYYLLKEGRLDESERMLKALLNAKLTTEEAGIIELNISILLWKKGQTGKAVERLEKLMDHFVNTAVYSNLGFFYIELGKYDRALEINKEAFEYNSGSNAIIDNLALSYFKTGQTDKAASIYEDLIPRKPGFPEAYYNYGCVLEAKGDIALAVEMFKKTQDFKLGYLSSFDPEQVRLKLEQYA